MKRMRLQFYAALACSMLALAACSSDDEPLATEEPPQTDSEAGDGSDSDSGGIRIVEPDGGFSVERCKVLNVSPTITGSNRYDIQWMSGDSLLAAADSLEFIALTPGTYDITMLSTDTAGVQTDIEFAITVVTEADEYSPYVTSVPDYRPAPGQFVNELPEYSEGDTQSDMNRKALESIGYNTRGLVSLGSYGGYVVCGFDHTIVNVHGQYDFKVLGNTFYSSANPNTDASAAGGSSEPGIVMVAYDRNKNGIPDDDEWYELAGSEYHKETTVKGYEITYYRPEEGHVAVPGGENEQWNSDAEYILWTDNIGNEGYVCKNTYHKQDYYPQWIDDDYMIFSGTLLPDNAVDESGQGTYWVFYAFDWGYADNGLNADDTSNFDIDWAVDADGNSVSLPGIDFVKIYTGVNQYCGWLGETSTEVMGVTDLHLAQ